MFVRHMGMTLQDNMNACMSLLIDVGITCDIHPRLEFISIIFIQMTIAYA